MTVREYLGQAQFLDEHILEEKQECKRLRLMAQSLRSPSLDERVDGSHSGEAPFVMELEKLAAKEKRIEENIKKMIALKVQLSQVIGQVKQPERRTVLRMRYLQGKSIEEIMEKLHCSKRTAIRWEREAEREITLPPDAIRL